MKKTKFTVLTSLLPVAMLLFGCTEGKNPIDPFHPERHETGTYKNAVYEVGADPTIFRDPISKNYYCYTTQATFDWYGTGTPTISYGPILKSTDMVNWNYVGAAFPTYDTLPDWLTNKDGDEKVDRAIWAPHVIYHNGQYLYYYSLAVWGNNNNGIGVATSTSPEGPFVDQGKIIDGLSTDNRECIDPCVVEEDGKLYMTYGSFSEIAIFELTQDGLRAKEVEPDGKIVKTKIASSAYEGSFLVKMYGWWYLFGSSGSCCEGAASTYYVNCYRSKSIMGPYKDAYGKLAIVNPSGTTVITPFADGSLARGTGHNSVAEDDDGTFWLCYHAYEIDPNDPTKALGSRKLCIDHLEFDENEFPVVENLCSTMGKEGTKAPYIAK